MVSKPLAIILITSLKLLFIAYTVYFLFLFTFQIYTACCSTLQCYNSVLCLSLCLVSQFDSLHLFLKNPPEIANIQLVWLISFSWVNSGSNLSHCNQNRTRVRLELDRGCRSTPECECSVLICLNKLDTGGNCTRV